MNVGGLGIVAILALGGSFGESPPILYHMKPKTKADPCEACLPCPLLPSAGSVARLSFSCPSLNDPTSNAGNCDYCP